MRIIHHSTPACFLISLGLASWLGCASMGATTTLVDPLRIADVMAEGDAARRASLRLIDEGLVADARGDGSRARARYERALQVDASNPYAYLAIARHHVEKHDPTRALQFLDRADSLFRMHGEIEPSMQVHLLGLRGGALYDSGKVEEGVELLDQARELSPRIWGDGALNPDELR